MKAMAPKDGERRMLFDTRGKRRQVIRVVYATLALLMGASLFLVVGPFNLGELAGNSSDAGNAAEVFEDRAERIEARLVKNPTDENELLQLAKARAAAANAYFEPAAAGEVPAISTEGREAFDAADEAWNDYLKQAGDEPSPTGAQLFAVSFFRLAESSLSIPEAIENIARATAAQEIAAEERPSVNSLSTLAIYRYYNGEYAAGDKTAKQAAADAGGKPEKEAVEKQLEEYRKGSQAFAKQRKEAAKFQQETGKESLQDPFSLGGAAAGE